MARTRKLFQYGTLVFLLISSLLPALGQQISDAAIQQMDDALRVKRSLTRGQRKISSSLLFGMMKSRQQSVGTVPNDVFKALKTDKDGLVQVDLKTQSLPMVLKRINDVGGKVVYASQHSGTVRANLPIFNIESIADMNDVQWIRTAARAKTNGITATQSDLMASPTMPFHKSKQQSRTSWQQSLPMLASNGFHPSLHALLGPMHIVPFIGAVTSQGYVAHGVNQAVQFGYDGTGVKVGILSDSALPDQVAALIATGDLPSDVTVVPGQEGPSDSGNEGTAIMEIVHDLAPGAKLFFATAFNGEGSFSDNIRTLRFVYGCDIIVDDVTYSNEGVFQDGIIAQAVDDVTADGALYFSSAGNNGNLTYKNAKTWEGDFVDGGSAGPVIESLEGVPVPIHNFGTATTPRTYNTLTTAAGAVLLRWSDPLGASNNDYDLFVLNSSGTQIIGIGLDAQTGIQDPYEEAVPSGTSFPAGSRVVVARYEGASRALHLDTFGTGQLSISTSGSTVGHNAGLNSVSIAATAWSSARNGTRPFSGFTNPTEVFSSDGPRKIFYNPDGTPITAGNYLFSTNGGATLQKPDLTAADGVFTKTPGYLPFFGTSAAAPHAAAIAALVKSANPSLTNVQIKNIMLNTALDTMTQGVDRDSGYGITMALPAIQAALGY